MGATIAACLTAPMFSSTQQLNVVADQNPVAFGNVQLGSTGTASFSFSVTSGSTSESDTLDPPSFACAAFDITPKASQVASRTCSGSGSGSGSVVIPMCTSMPANYMATF